MADDRMAQKRNMGPEPVEADPNHVREKTYTPSEVPEAVRHEAEKLPEGTAENKVREDMPAAAAKVKKHLA